MTSKELTDKIFQILQAFEHTSRAELRAAINDKIIIGNHFFGPQCKPISDRVFRALIASMIAEGYPIGSSPDSGYFVVNTQSRFDEATSSLKAKIGGLARRVHNLKKSAEGRFGITIQTEFEFNKAI